MLFFSSNTSSALWIAFLLGWSSTLIQAQNECATVLQIYKIMKGTPVTTTNGCAIPGVTSANGYVTRIQWFNMQLEGTIPKEIGNLRALNYLMLYANFLTGPIPSEIGNLQQLTYLHLGKNRLSGVIPQSIGSLTNLQKLYLNDNQLTGAPSSITSIPAPLKVLFPNPMSSLPYRAFTQNPAGVLSPANWTNLMNASPSRKRQSTSSVSVDELYAMCPLNNVQSADVASGCVAGIYNKFCLNLSNLGPCHKAYDDVVAASIFRPLGICAAWKSGPKSATCVSLIASFRVDLGYIVLTSTNANNFVRTIFGSTTYSPCVNTPLVKCTW